MKMKYAFGITAALALLVLASVGFAATASAGNGWDGCPDGQFVLEWGCVLCLPGYSHHATGATSEHGYACYECAKNRSATSLNPKQICRVQAQPQSMSNSPASKVEKTASSKTSTSSRNK